MRRIYAFVLALGIMSTMTGCLITSHPRHGKACGPAYHWNGNRCVHNGNGRRESHKSHKSNRDHRH